MVENGIKSGKIVSQAALKATTQVLQNGSGNIGRKKRREDVATIVSAPRTHVLGNSHNTIFLPKLHNILSHTLHIMFLMHNQLHPLLIHNGVHQLHKIIHHPHKFIKILLEFLSALDHNTKREMASKMSSLLLGSRMLACSRN